MASELFVDTSGFFALLVQRDPAHAPARQILSEARGRRRLITTDYVLDETATLLKARSAVQLIQPLFDAVRSSLACRIVWMDDDRFGRLQALFLKHLDQSWSFTDCLSFCIMKELGLREALSTDAHFEQAGYVALLR
jgi:predicted nucleic acid-binding protein